MACPPPSCTARAGASPGVFSIPASRRAPVACCASPTCCNARPAAWLAGHGIRLQPGTRQVSLFCYEPAALPDLLAQLAGQPVQLLVTAGRATAAVQACARPAGLALHFLPYLTQDDYDHLLWACDLNFVRGEDSLVRALWAGKPLVWHIYPQHDDAHHAKLEAWLDWLEAPASLRAFHHTWNGVDTGPLPVPELEDWSARTLQARQLLLAERDLLVQLLEFVAHVHR